MNRDLQNASSLQAAVEIEQEMGRHAVIGAG
jgi:hypothetical protein